MFTIKWCHRTECWYVYKDDTLWYPFGMSTLDDVQALTGIDYDGDDVEIQGRFH